MTHPLPGDIFRSGQVLNNTYEIEEVLGRGGAGEVYRARNQITGRVVAVKALNRAMSVNDAYIELMRREEEMRLITSDAVVRYTDCARSDEGHVYLVMDYVAGTPLSAWLERGRVDPADLLTVARRVAEGLVATHAHNIVHRDLSPDNIILRRDDPAQAVIIDFGIAKDANVGARTIVGENFAGKYEYAAPEQMHGRADARSDLYALGATLLATFRGAVPDVGRSPGEIIAQKQKPLDVNGVPDPLRSLIMELTNPDPARRLPSAAALVREIDRLGFRPPPLPKKGRRWWLLLPAAAFAALAGAWGLGLLGGQTTVARDPLVLGAPPTAALDPLVPGAPPAAAPDEILLGVPPAQAPDPLVPDAPRAAGIPAPSIAQLEETAARVGACGPMEVTFGPGPDVTVIGRVSNPDAAGAIRQALRPLIGDRRLRDEIEVLNPPVCTVLQALPASVGASPIRIGLGYRDRAGPNPVGAYRSGDQPRFTLEVPPSLTGGFLWVVLVDVSGDVITLLPTQNQPENALSAYPVSGTESRLIPLNAPLVVSKPFGKSMVLTIHSDQPLSPAGPADTETAETFAAKLGRALEGDVAIRSVAKQFIETHEQTP